MRAERPRRLDHFGFCIVSNRCLRGNSSHSFLIKYGFKHSTVQQKLTKKTNKETNKPTSKRTTQKRKRVISDNSNSGAVRIRGKNITLPCHFYFSRESKIRNIAISSFVTKRCLRILKFFARQRHSSIDKVFEPSTK